MKKRVLAIMMACMLLCSALTVSADTAYIYDTADAVSPYLEDDSVWMPTAAAVSSAALSVGGKSAVLLEQATGEMLFAKNAHEKLPIASVTKIMTLLLVMEALDAEQLRIDEVVTCSKTAASMGGSQIWLEEGEQMTVDELLKAAAIVSANDACAALAEHLCGTIEQYSESAVSILPELNPSGLATCRLMIFRYPCEIEISTLSAEIWQPVRRLPATVIPKWISGSRKTIAATSRKKSRTSA